MIPTHCYRITCYGCAGCRTCRCANCQHMRALVEPPADHLTTGFVPVVPATHLDAPVSDVVWDCLAGDLDGETEAADFDVEGDAHDLAAQSFLKRATKANPGTTYRLAGPHSDGGYSVARVA